MNQSTIADEATRRDTRLLQRLRLVGWGLVILLIALPAIAMAVGADVDWGSEDFIAAAILLGGSGLLVEALVRVSNDWAYRIAALLTVGIAFVTVWMNLAVGIVGSEDNVFNLYYFALVPLLAAGALVVRLRPAGMAALMRIAAIFFLAMLVATFVAGRDVIAWNGAVGLVGLHLFFALPCVIASLLFDRAARRHSAT